MGDYTASTDMTLEAAITAGSMVNGENLTIDSGAVVTCDQTPSILIGDVDIDDGKLLVDGQNISAGNMINFVGEYQSGISVDGLGVLEVDGDWYSAGTTDGTNSQVISLATYYDSSFCVDVVPMIQVETGRRIDYNNASGTAPEVDDYVCKSSDLSIRGRIVEVNTGSSYLVVRWLIGSLVNDDAIEVRKIVDNGGPNLEVTWTADVNNGSGDIQESGIYQEFANSRANATSCIGSFNHGVGGFVFDNVYQSTTLTFGTAAGSTGGFVAPSGCDIRIPNVHFCTSNIASYGSSNTYHDGSTTIDNWYDLNTSGAGEVDLSICNIGISWFGSANAYSFEASYVGSCVEFGSTGCATQVLLEHCTSSPDPITRTYSSRSIFRTTDLINGAVLTDCMRIGGENDRHDLRLESVDGVTVTGFIFSNAGVADWYDYDNYHFLVTACSGVTFNNNTSIGNDSTGSTSFFRFDSSNTGTVYNTFFSASQDETAQTVATASNELELINKCTDISFVGLTLLGDGVAGRYIMEVIDGDDIKIRCMGLIDNKVDLNAGGRTVVSLTGRSNNIDIARIWVYDVNVAYATAVILVNTVTGVVLRNCSGDYLSSFAPIGASDTNFKGVHSGVGSGGILNISYSYPGTYGRQIHDGFTSDTAGFIACILPPPSQVLDNTTIVSGTPVFDRSGLLNMTSGDVIIIEQDENDDFCKGHTAFPAAGTFFTATVGGGSWGDDEWTNITVDFQYDVGSGWNGSWLNARTRSNWTTISGTYNLEEGVKVKFRFTATGTQTGMSRFIISTETTIADQKANLHPIDQAIVNLYVKVVDKNQDPIQDVQTSIHRSSDILELMNEDTTALGEAESAFTYDTDTDIIIKCRKSDEADDPRYKAFSTTGTITSSGFSLTVTLEESLVLN